MRHLVHAELQTVRDKVKQLPKMYTDALDRLLTDVRTAVNDGRR